MKINLIPSKKLALLSAAFCAVMLACSDNASALTLTVGYNKYLGQIIPGTGGNAQRTAYVNHMIGMNLGGFDLFMSQPFFRSTNNFGSLPTAVFALNEKRWTCPGCIAEANVESNIRNPSSA